ncbi:MAG TPA: site-2 protease family protein, partial [Kofleriaceae bacterium]|nr:site-2 protease family protein [Kofleriaceae bacterium]
LVRFKLRETEYQIGAFPIGGYVRILGVEADTAANKADVRRSFAGRPLWQRLVIVFAGPAANLILPVVIYFVFFAGHTVLPAAVIGDVLDGGAASRAGLEPGDRVIDIDGRAIRYWEEIENAVSSSPGKELHLRVMRGGKMFERYLTPVEEIVRNRDGRMTSQGWVGITYAPFVPIVGVLDDKSPAARAGIRTGDLIISVDGQAVRNWSDVQHHIGRFARRTSLVYFRGTEMPGVPQIQLLRAGFADLVPDTHIEDVTLRRQTYTGLEHAEMFVAHVDPASPAEAAGLRPGDLVVALDDIPVAHWLDLDQRLQAQPGRTFKLTWKRAANDKPGVDGHPAAATIQTMSGEVTQVEGKTLDEYDHTVTRLVFGARNDVDRGTGATVAIEGRFGYALTKALQRTGETITTMVSGFFQIVGGDTPSDALGGPLMMYRVASVSGNQGWDSFLLMIALISVNLGLINLLPIPMLDGGHLLVFAIEGVRRRPLTDKTRERVQLAGLVVVGLITILAVRNDIMRYLLR